jgi:hypothetical protein
MDLSPVAPPKATLRQSLLDLYLSAGIEITPELVDAIDVRAGELSPSAASTFAPLVEAVARANLVAQQGRPLGRDQANRRDMGAELVEASAVEGILAGEGRVVWPASAWSDPLGFTRIGHGNESLVGFYYVTLETAGNNSYLDNSGSTNEFNVEQSAAVMVDEGGNNSIAACSQPGAPACPSPCFYAINCWYGSILGTDSLSGIGLAVVQGGGNSIIGGGGGGAGGSGVGAAIMLSGENWFTGGGAGSGSGGLAVYYARGGRNTYALGLASLGFGDEGAGLFLADGSDNNYSHSEPGSWQTGDFGSTGCNGAGIFVDNGSRDTYPSTGWAQPTSYWSGLREDCLRIPVVPGLSFGIDTG